MSSKNMHNKQCVERSGQNGVGSMDERIENAKKEAGLPDADKLTIHFDAEVKYVRRTAAEFHAGAEPLRPGQDSHRMSRIALSVTPEIYDAIKFLKRDSGLDQTRVLRAALRYAIRHAQLAGSDGDEFDPKKELETDFTVTLTSEGKREPDAP